MGGSSVEDPERRTEEATLEDPERRVEETTPEPEPEPKPVTPADAVEDQPTRSGEDSPMVMREEDAEDVKRTPSEPPPGSGPETP
jgi:hypothetical protein